MTDDDDVLLRLSNGLNRIIQDIYDMDMHDEDKEYLLRALKGAFYICVNGKLDDGIDDCIDFYEHMQRQSYLH